MNDIQNRFRSPVAWASVASLIGIVLGTYGLYDSLGLTNQSYQNIVNGIFAVCATFGIWNSPTNKDSF